MAQIKLLKITSGIITQLNDATDSARVFSAGVGIDAVSNAASLSIGDTVVSISDPSSGVILYSVAGVLKVRQPDGTTVTIQNGSGSPSGSAGGDLSETYPNPTVAKINGYSVATQTLNSGTDGYVLTWDNADGYYRALPALTSGSAGGDLSGSYPNPTVSKVNGASVPASGSLTTGNVLQVNGSNSLTYGAVNLAGGSNYVTGVLPTGNQASQTLGGDLSGTTASASVLSITGSSGVINIATSGNIFTWASGTTAPGIAQTAATVGNGATMRFTAQDTSAVGSTGGAMSVQSGNATGASGTGGTLFMTSGGGITTNGNISFRTNTNPTGSANNVTFFSFVNPNPTGSVIAQFVNTVTAATINQNGTSTSDGYTLTIQAQNATGGSSTGGSLVLTSGTGTTAAGNVNIKTGGTSKLTISPTLTTSVNDIAIGVNSANTGALRLPYDGYIVSRNFSNTQDLVMVNNTNNIGFSEIAIGTGFTAATTYDLAYMSANTTLAVELFDAVSRGTGLSIYSDTITLGKGSVFIQGAFSGTTTNAGNGVGVLCISQASTMPNLGLPPSNAATLYVNASNKLNLFETTGNTLELSNSIKWGADNNSPSLTQSTRTNADGYALTIQAQNSSFSGSTGGALNLTSGTGVSIAGNVAIQTGGTTRLTISPSSVTLQSLAGSGSGYVAVDNSGVLSFVAGAGPSGSAGGDLSGSYPNPTVAKINGATVPTAGSLTTGNVLQVSGSSALSYAAINLAGGSNYVTGVLPIGNQASQTLGGDLSGTTASASVVSLTGSSGTVNIATTGNILTWASGTTAPGIAQSTVASGTGATLTVQAQNTSSGTGGALTLTSGTGTTTAGSVNIQTGGVSRVTVNPTTTTFADTATALTITPTSAGTTTLQFATGVTAANINQSSTSIATGATLQLSAQAATGDGYNGGNIGLAAGNSSGTTGTGGSVNIQAGSGNTAGGSINLRQASTTAIAITPNPTGATQIATVAGATSFKIIQSTNVTNGATGATFTIQAQNASGTTSTGGALTLTSGTGTTTAGNINLQTGGTTIASVTPNKLITSKGLRKNVTTITGTYTVLVTDEVVIVTTNGAAFTITLPSSPTDGDYYIIKDGVGNANTRNLTISGNGKNIDGAANFTINTSYGSITAIYNGTEYSVI